MCLIDDYRTLFFPKRIYVVNVGSFLVCSTVFDFRRYLKLNILTREVNIFCWNVAVKFTNQYSDGYGYFFSQQMPVCQHIILLLCNMGYVLLVGGGTMYYSLGHGR